jgi:hypothetical protein
VGISAHDKLDASLKAKLIEEAVFMSYGRSGEKLLKLWLEVADYIDQAYDIDSIEKIYFSTTKTETKKKSVRKARKYILGN